MPTSDHQSWSEAAGGRRLAALRMLAIAGLLAALILPSTSCSSRSNDAPPPEGPEQALSGISVDVHKQVGCGCCDAWAAYVREHGAEVTIAEDPALAAYREQMGVPAEAAGCHTALIDGFVVEGHVPVPAIIRFGADRPAAVGIAVPGMPPDGPGMGGDEATWAAMDVLLVLRDGALSSFDF